MALFIKGQIPWNKNKQLHYSVWNKGLRGLPPRHTTSHIEETKLKIGIALKNRWAEGIFKNRINVTPTSIEKIRNAQRKGNFINCTICNKSFYSSPSAIKRNRKYCSKECNGLGTTGDKSVRWNGGPKYKSKHLRTKAYKKWRYDVFLRDKFVCQSCEKTGVFLHAHHIKSYTHYPEVRYDKDNGVTLCKECHFKLHSLLFKLRRRLKFPL